MTSSTDMIELHKVNRKKMIDDLGDPRRFGSYMQDVLPQITTRNYNIRGLDARFKNLKKFDVVHDFSDHLIARHMMEGPDYDNKEIIMKEWEIFKTELPKTDGIFVRVYESRIYLLTAAIIGAEGTPYHDGVFIFDILFPGSYPKKSGPEPVVRFHSGGFQLNPNIFSCGEVVLHHYVKNVKTTTWEAGTHNMFDLLLVIRDVLLNPNPLSNRSGYHIVEGSLTGLKLSVLYNENTVIKSLKTMVYIINNPPKNFEDLVGGHFRARARDILMKCGGYIQGGFIGGKKEELCSITFKKDVAACIKSLIDAFVKVGAKEALQFLPLSEMRFPVPKDGLQVAKRTSQDVTSPPETSTRKSARLLVHYV